METERARRRAAEVSARWAGVRCATLALVGAPSPEDEYDGKLGVRALGLRAGSCAHGHARASDRSFSHPAARRQLSGVRLARDA